MTKTTIPMFMCLFFASAAGAAEASSSDKPTRDVNRMSLEELMSVEVTSVSKKEEKLSAAPAAIHVITQDDLRRSGVTSLAEALRMAPGLHVGRMDAHTWALSSRGFADQYANKLLVLMDGRSVYTPLFSGVYWEAQDTLLDDVDRIEVVRGPGGALWGANAVNGVINIITKRAEDTQGALLMGGGGTEERGFAGFRYGGKLAQDVYFRVYGKYFNRDHSALPTGADAYDSRWVSQGGFRLDWAASSQDALTFQGDLYSGRQRQTYILPSLNPPYANTVQNDGRIAGGNLLGRWSHAFSDEAQLQLQFYYDRTEREVTIIKDLRDTFDLDSQSRFQLGERQEMMWGLGARRSSDDIGNSEPSGGLSNVTLDPNQRTIHLWSAFVQDEITLVNDRLRLTLGSKFEHNDFTGFEIQPSGRLLWTPGGRQSVWASVARAVRTPSRIEDDGRVNLRVLPPGTLPPPLPVVIALQGNRDFKAEELIAYELGYRVQPLDRLALDVAAFYNVYDDLRSLEVDFRKATGVVSPSPHLVIPGPVANNLYGETYGVELATTIQITDWWRLRGGYTFLEMQLHKRAGSLDTLSEQDEGKSPRHQFALHSSMDLPGRVELDSALRYVDNLAAVSVPGYLALDVRLAWKPINSLELSVVGQSLLDNQHPEFRPSFIATQPAEVEHGVYGKLIWRF